MKEGEMVQTLALSVLNLDGGTQLRERLNDAVAEEYAELVREGGSLPPAVAYFDGEVYWLSDGFHRYFGHQFAGRLEMVCEVRQGTLDDAILHAAEANARHGLRRTPEDNRKAILTLHQRWKDKSDQWIADRCGIDRSRVTRILGVFEGRASHDLPRVVEGRDGKAYTIPPRPREVFGFQTSRAWSEQQVEEARTALDRLPEAERRVAAVMISEPDIPAQVGVDMAKRVASSTAAERQRVINLYQSEDSRDRDQAVTLAAGRVCPPDPRLIPLRAAVREVRSAVRQFPTDPETPALTEILFRLEEVVGRITERYEERKHDTVTA